MHHINAAYCYACYVFRDLSVCLRVQHTGKLCIMAAPIEIPFGVETDSSGHKQPCIRWRHLANTIERPVSGGDAAL